MISRYGCLATSAIFLTISTAAWSLPQELPTDTTKGEIRSILREAAALLPKIPADQLPSVASNIAGAQTAAGDLEGALATARTPGAWKSAMAVVGVAYSLANQGRLPEALRVVAEWEDGGGGRSVAYQQMVWPLSQHGDFEGAFSVARMLSERSTYVQSVMLIYDAQYKPVIRAEAMSTLREALEAVERAPEPSASERAALYTIIARFLNLAGNRTEAAAVAQRIQTLADDPQNAAAKIILLRGVAQAYTYAGDFSSALQIMRSMKSSQNGDSSYLNIAVQQAYQGHTDDALATMEELGPNDYSAMAGVFAETGNGAAARLAANRIPDLRDRAYALASAAFEEFEKAPGEAGLTADLAWKTVQELAQAPKKSLPDHSPAHGTLMFIAATRARLGDTSGALEIMSVLDATDRAWAMENLMDKMVEDGREEAALTLARNQEDPQVRARSLMMIARALMDRLQQHDKSGRK
jgi:tetratricopeptide (TPR) repeat protein